MICWTFYHLFQEIACSNVYDGEEKNVITGAEINDVMCHIIHLEWRRVNCHIQFKDRL